MYDKDHKFKFAGIRFLDGKLKLLWICSNSNCSQIKIEDFEEKCLEG